MGLLVVSGSTEIVHFGEIPVPVVSRHDLIYSVHNIKSPKLPTQFIECRNFKTMDEEAFLSNVQNTRWEIIHGSRDGISVERTVDTLNSMILNIYDTHAPLITNF